MKKINLRELYPDVYTTDFFVDVTEEVMETIRAAERAEAAYERQSEVKIHLLFTLSRENHFYIDSSPFRTCISASLREGFFDFLQYRLIFSV